MTFLDQKTAMLRSIQLLHIYKEFTIVFFLSVQIKTIEKIIENDLPEAGNWFIFEISVLGKIYDMKTYV